jgi:predicted protein tyrosine phosphatase
MPRDKLNVLFLCAKNKWRSPTGESLYRADPRLAVRSAGVKSGAKRQVTESDLLWAHLIFVMEREHRRILLQNFPLTPVPEIVVLDIPDDYQYMDPELQQLIRESVDPIVENTIHIRAGS